APDILAAASHNPKVHRPCTTHATKGRDAARFRGCAADSCGTRTNRQWGTGAVAAVGCRGAGQVSGGSDFTLSGRYAAERDCPCAGLSGQQREEPAAAGAGAAAGTHRVMVTLWN